MRLADFYLAASAVLPILVFADTVRGSYGSHYATSRQSTT